MANDITISITLDTKGVKQGQEEINRALKAIEQNTRKASGSLKGIDRNVKNTGSAFQKQSKNVKQAGKSVTDYNKSLDNLSKATRLVDGPLGGIASRFQTLNSIIKQNAGGLAAFTVALAGVGFAIKATISNVAAVEEALFSAEGALKATGRSSELSAEQLDKFAIALGDATLTSRTAVLQAATALAQFSNVATDDFERVLSLAQDLSAVFGGDIVSNAQKLGRALQAPGQSITLLERVTGKLSPQFRELVLQLERTGQVARAQELIFERLSTIEGRATDQTKGLSGAFDSLGEASTNFAVAVGQASGITDAALAAINGLTAGIKTLGNNLDTVSSVLTGLGVAFTVGLIIPLTRTLALTQTSVIAVNSLGVAFVGAGAAAGRFGKLTTVANAALLKLNTTAKASTVIFGRLLKFLGGPIGIALGVAAFAYSELTDEAEGANEKLDKTADELGNIQEKIEGIDTAGIAAFGRFSDKAVKQIKSLADTVENDLAKGIETALEGRAIDAAKNFADALESSFRSSLSKIAAAALREKIVVPIVSGFADSIGAGFGIGNLSAAALDPTGGTSITSLSGAASGLSGLISGFNTPILSDAIIADLSFAISDLAGLSQTSLAVVEGLQNFTPLSGIAGFGGSLVSGALGFEGLGASIGGTAGSIIGTAIAGPLGAFAGNIIGSAFGSAFGGTDDPAASFFIEAIDPDAAIQELNLLSKHIGTDFPDQLGQGINGVISQLTAFGIDLEGIGITGGVDQGTGFFGVPAEGSSAVAGQRFLERLIEFNASNPEETAQALSDFVVILAKMGTTLDENVATVLNNIVTEGRSVDEILGDLQFAATFEDLLRLPPVFTDIEVAIANLEVASAVAIKRANELGLAEERLADRRDRAFNRLVNDFNRNIGIQIAGIADPAILALQQLNEEFVTVRRDAIALGADLVAVEELFGLRRQEVLEQSNTLILDGFASTFNDIKNLQDALRVDPRLSGLSRQGRLTEAQSQFNEVRAAIESGDQKAFDRLEDASRNLLDAAVDVFGSNSDFIAIRDSVDSFLTQAQTLQTSTLDIDQSILDEAIKQTGLLSSISDNLLASQQIADVALLRSSDDSALLENINRINNLPERLVRQFKSQAGFDFTDPTNAQRLFREFVQINPAAGTVFNELVRSVGGLTQTFQTGGVARPGFALVGEAGPELVNFGTSSRVFNAPQTRSILSDTAGGGFSELIANELRQMREDNAEQSAIIAGLNAQMVQIQEETNDNITRARE